MDSELERIIDKKIEENIIEVSVRDVRMDYQNRSKFSQGEIDRHRLEMNDYDNRLRILNREETIPGVTIKGYFSREKGYWTEVQRG